jgi:exopolysaccharide production protein ExoQ
VSDAAPGHAHGDARRHHKSGWGIGDGLRSAAFARAFTLASLGAVFSSFAIEWLAGLVVYATILSCLCLLGLAVLIARRREISLLRLVPTTIVIFVLWAGASMLWTTTPSYTGASWLATVAVAFIAIVIGHVRDTLQTVRALADVMRWLLSISLALEVVDGLLLRTPIDLLEIQGNIANLGPVQGMFGTRNLLGLVAVIALVAFVVEWRTNAVPPGVSVYSVALGGILAVMSDSPTVLVLAVAVGVATAMLMLVRHAAPHRRRTLQWLLGAVVATTLVAAYLVRHQIITRIGAGSDFTTRARLWQVLAYYVRFHPVQGFGWYGPWVPDLYPFSGVNYVLTDHYTSALNAYIDVLLQLGWVGLSVFIVLAGMAVVRSWLVASERRSVIYAWTPITLVALLTDSLFESFSLFGLGWLMLVLCTVRAGQSRSWRERVDLAPDGPELPATERL